jgi:hypothetical protein
VTRNVLTVTGRTRVHYGMVTEIYRMLGAGAFLLAGMACMLCPATAGERPAKKRIVFIAGRGSHGYEGHAHEAGCKLLARALKQAVPGARVDVLTGWPKKTDALDDADAVVVYSDGLGSHEINGREEEVRALIDRGVGLGFLHYAVVVPAGTQGDLMLDAMGGHYDPNWSVNPFWEADFDSLPDHPVTRGVRPFKLRDEWYYHMRFRADENRATPILTALPPKETLNRPDGPHHGNPHVRAAVLERKEPQQVAWAYERPNGGRGFGFTGAHSFWNFAHDDFRKVVLNAAAWLAHIEVPAEGLDSPTPSLDELVEILGPPPKKWNRGKVEKLLEGFRQ